MITPPRYYEWLAHVFDHPVSENAWYFELESPNFEGSDEEITDLIVHTMNHSGSDLLRFSDAQVGQALNYLFNNSCSDYVFCIMDGNFSAERKREAVRSIEKQYTDCFALRCMETLCSGKHCDSKLNSICFMLWDVTPLNYWEGRPDDEAAYTAVVDVMVAALKLKHIACIESALHGLGHTHTYAPERISALIQWFIAANPDMPPDLLAYAKCAAVGYVQ